MTSISTILNRARAAKAAHNITSNELLVLMYLLENDGNQVSTLMYEQLGLSHYNAANLRTSSGRLVARGLIELEDALFGGPPKGGAVPNRLLLTSDGMKLAKTISKELLA